MKANAWQNLLKALPTPAIRISKTKHISVLYERLVATIRQEKI
jgi:hypothetical protein